VNDVSFHGACVAIRRSVRHKPMRRVVMRILFKKINHQNNNIRLKYAASWTSNYSNIAAGQKSYKAAN
jgi:hypothetical protein